MSGSRRMDLPLDASLAALERFRKGGCWAASYSHGGVDRMAKRAVC